MESLESVHRSGLVHHRSGISDRANPAGADPVELATQVVAYI